MIKQTFFDHRREEGQLVQCRNIGDGPRVRHHQIQFGVKALLDVRTTGNLPKDVSQGDRSGVHASNTKTVVSR